MPSVLGVLETCIYVQDLDLTEKFYDQVLGLRVVGKDAGRDVFFRVAPGSLLLAFRAEATRKGGVLPPHGAEGETHLALTIPPEELVAWKEHLARHGVEVELEYQWPRGISLYFRDPDRNLVELVSADIWPASSAADIR